MKTLRCVFVIVLSMMLTSGFVFANTSKKMIPPSEALVDSHLFIDEISQCLSYSSYRVMIDYMLAKSSNDSLFMSDSLANMDDMTKWFDTVKTVRGCSDTLRQRIDEISENLKTSRMLLMGYSTNTNAKKNVDSDVLGVLNSIDAINDLVLTSIRPQLDAANLDIITRGIIELHLRLVQRANIKALYAYLTGYGSDIAALDDYIYLRDLDKSNLDEYLNKAISKAADSSLKTVRTRISESIEEVYVLSRDLINRARKIESLSDRSDPLIMNLDLVNRMITDYLINMTIT